MQQTEAPDTGATPGEMARMSTWARETLFSGSAPPFSFRYDGQASQDLLPGWRCTMAGRDLGDHRHQVTRTWADDRTGLQVRCVAVTYDDFPVVEWTVYLRNTGDADTPVLADVQGLDTYIERPEPARAAVVSGQPGEFVLHHWRGDFCSAEGYRPFRQLLWQNTSQTFAPLGGRGSNSAFPYYNLQVPAAEPSAGSTGLMLAVGWPGQWSAAFARDAGRGLRLRAGQERTHLRLRPGEEIRTPLIVLLFWEAPHPDRRDADVVRAHNLWRRWMWAHNVPHAASGAPPPTLLFGNTSLEFNEMTGANEENQKRFIDRYREERIGVDCWWMDAGWYPCQGQWPLTGTWEPDAARFPAGLRAVSDHAHAAGAKALLWFEPERVAPGTWLWQEHPEWLHPELPSAGNESPAQRSRLLDLGSPEARRWLTDHVDRLLREQGIDVYRQDFNFDPLPFWRESDTRLSPTDRDREGISENLHVQGYLAFWDELRRRHPDLIIDTCASGGRRNDVETLRRAVPLHPTDYDYTDLATKQAFHATLFRWIPYFGSNTMPIETVDTYAVRSGHGMGLVLGYDLRRSDLDLDLLRRLTGEWRDVAPYCYGDFYPLTPWSRDEASWMAWQFHRPDLDAGLVEAFRRAGSVEEGRALQLWGLAADTLYRVTDLDAPGASRLVAGERLMAEGLPVSIPGKPGAAAWVYRREGQTDRHAGAAPSATREEPCAL